MMAMPRPFPTHLLYSLPSQTHPFSHLSGIMSFSDYTSVSSTDEQPSLSGSSYRPSSDEASSLSENTSVPTLGDESLPDEISLLYTDKESSLPGDTAMYSTDEYSSVSMPFTPESPLSGNASVSASPITEEMSLSHDTSEPPPDEEIMELYKWTVLIPALHQMMFVAGETADPPVETTILIEQIVHEQVIEMVSLSGLTKKGETNIEKAQTVYCFSYSSWPTFHHHL